MAKKTILFITIFGCFFIGNFIIKKNGLSKDSAYMILFYLLLLLFFPSVMNNSDLIISNFFIILALRRLISLQSPKSPKEKKAAGAGAGTARRIPFPAQVNSAFGSYIHVHASLTMVDSCPLFIIDALESPPRAPLLADF
jgi:hypothetical protein